MVLKNALEVKKWFRNISLTKRELNLKISFYQDLAADFAKDEEFKHSAEYYRTQIAELEGRLKALMADVNRLLSCLDESEKLILTARYINLVKWDFIEFQVFYSRRQAVRIHDKAILKLVGQTVGDDVLYEL